MSDIINQIEGEGWITIKDASDLLGVSERHAWSIIYGKDASGRQIRSPMQTKKLLNKSRKKIFVLRSDIEKYHKDQQERKQLEALKASPLSEMSEMSEKKGEFEISESDPRPLSERGRALSEGKYSLPALLKEAQDKQERLIKASARWQVISISLVILMIILGVIIGLSLNEVKSLLSEREKALSESREAISEMSERVFMLSEREKQALQTIFKQEFYIRDLQTTIETLKEDKANHETGDEQRERGREALTEPGNGHL